MIGDTQSSIRGGAVRNRLLRLIPNHELSEVLTRSDSVRILPRQILHHWRLPMDYVYFVEHGLVSVSARVDQDRFIEAWLIGSEGMIGAPLVLTEIDQTPPHRRVVQVAGTAIRMSAREFLSILPQLPTLRRVLLRYIDVVLLQTSQSGVCNAVHPVKQRLARWLLVASSALEEDKLPLTHEVLGHLLGVRRASVTECLEALEKDGLIRSSRGLVCILNFHALRQVSCTCFDTIAREYRRQLNPDEGITTA
ncbi:MULTISPECIES: Crp/Fnr family transcriptional regulator [Bradyrhizobium]|uniref:Crp/Fnr family transcriptional regulator n=2 Tax=Bradyrhizobium TaxID=374 RepID=A0A2U3Q6Q2_9BRAD|nr:Crp/Fnr family transcriptional regulator [Bradyrhizobium vignae]MBP0115382.1 Crp/Fnr family transcriptional regulator [Bradyrhizobium vignae]RXG90267.1 Crp/Fnr family transcriptional regulator [Bradyrhizobium vignae]SPP97123.1 putative transcriptional regulator, Crp/Fnr family (Modular protein) [Bradyrhizobium vignae]